MKNFNEYFEKDLAEDFYLDELDDLSFGQIRNNYREKNSNDYFKDLIDDWFESKSFS